ncbi:hypothetical protein [Hydrogenimonas urashimensis]|uniref:hypothetical protein n=1 Tax=Hydrogenimonas urashimensis TaxID=2740515 RepID=UPI0019157EC4|nr:hypothetical protein [Hydrogenimonas urashimensis]
MPIVTMQVINGQPIFKDRDVLESLNDGYYQVKITNMDYRTIKQNAAMHLYFTMVADALNEAGLDMKQVIKADVPWSPSSVKEVMWKRLQKAMLGKESTTKLKKEEIDKVYDVMNRLLGEKFGIHVPFPSKEMM